MDTRLIYVPANSRSNLDVGLRRGVWGWNEPPEPANAAKIRSCRAGDILMFVTGNVERNRGQAWTAVTLERVVLTELRSDVYQSTEPVWPGPTMFSLRVDLSVLRTLGPVPAGGQDGSFLASLRKSTSTHGVPEQTTLPDFAIAGIRPDDGVDAVDTDRVTTAIRRLEQDALRRQLLQGRATLPCAICGRVLPESLIRAAHIRRRADCTPVQRLDFDNVMAACVLGCDELFERGFLTVDETGRIRTHRLDGLGDLRSFVAWLDGRVCSAFSATSAPHFAAHDTRVNRLAGRV